MTISYYFKLLSSVVICYTALAKCNSECYGVSYHLPFWSPDVPMAPSLPHKQHVQPCPKRNILEVPPPAHSPGSLRDAQWSQ